MFNTILVLIAGILIFFIGLMPIISRKYFDEMYINFWRDRRKLMTDTDSYIYNRYIRQLGFIIVGLLLSIYSLYEIFLK